MVNDAAPFSFKRGDSNQDGLVAIDDPLNTLFFLFMGMGNATCKDAMDFNDDAVLDVTDPLRTLVHLFIGGEPPAAPGASRPGQDPTVDNFVCGVP
jgi:hypothetical protein